MCAATLPLLGSAPTDTRSAVRPAQRAALGRGPAMMKRFLAHLLCRTLEVGLAVSVVGIANALGTALG